MKAAVYYANGGPEVFRYEDIDPPKCPKDGVLISVQAISVEDVDLGNRKAGALQRIPHIVGHQCSGEIIEVGPNVVDRHVGQRVVAVMNWGGYAEIAAALSRDTWPVPENVTMEIAAAVPIAWGTAHDAILEFGELQAGQTVLIHMGSNAFGLASAQIAKRIGAIVVATASAETLRLLMDAHKIDFGIDSDRTDFEVAIRAITGGSGANLVVGKVSGEALLKSIKSLSYRGRLMLLGVSGREDERPDPVLLWDGNKSLQGIFFPASLDAENDRVSAAIAEILTNIADGDFEVVIDRTFALSCAGDAHKYIEDRRAFGSVLLKP